MQANEYQQKAARTLLGYPDFPLSPEETMIIWNAIGLGGEAGEVLELIKKGIFHRHGVDKDKLKKELGDVLWYLTAICTKVGLTLGEVMEENIHKLEIAYPDGYSSEASKEKAGLPKEDILEEAFWQGWISQTDAASLEKRKKLTFEVAWPEVSREEIDKAIRRLGEIHLERAKYGEIHDGKGSVKSTGSIDSTSQPDAQ